MSQDPERVRDIPDIGPHWFHWLRGPALGDGHNVWTSPLFGQGYAFHPTRKFVTITRRVLRIPVSATVIPFEDILDLYSEESVESKESNPKYTTLSIKVFMRVVAPRRTEFRLADIEYSDKLWFSRKHKAALSHADELLKAVCRLTGFPGRETRMAEVLLRRVLENPGITHTALWQGLGGNQKFEESATTRLIDDGKISVARVGRVRRYFPQVGER